MKARLLVIEDDRRLAALLERDLGLAGYAVTVRHSGGEGLFAAEEEPYALIVLDLGLPDMDGLEVAAWLRGRVAADILMLTARGDLESRVAGLYAGASDYLTKPFHMQELLARVHVRLRGQQQGGVLEHGPLRLERDSSTLQVGEQSFVLPEREFALLALLLGQPGRLFSREALERQLYGAAQPESNTVEVFVCNLRRRLREAGVAELIQTVRGKGYMIR